MHPRVRPNDEVVYVRPSNGPTKMTPFFPNILTTVSGTRVSAGRQENRRNQRDRTTGRDEIRRDKVKN